MHASEAQQGHRAAGIGEDEACFASMNHTVFSWLVGARPDHNSSIQEKRLDSVFMLRINGLQCCTRTVDEAHYRAACEFGWRRRVCPELFWLINRDVVPDDAWAIMLSHRMGENAVGIPVLLHAWIVNSPKSDARGRAQVRNKHRFPDYEHAQMRICLRLEQRLECGGPPHADRSSRGKEHQYSHVGAARVELILEVTQVRCVQIVERGLATRSLVSAVEIKQPNKNGNSRQS